MRRASAKIDRASMSIDPTQVQLLAIERDYCFASWNHVFILIWRHDTTLEGLKALDKAMREHETRCPEGSGLLTIIEQGAPMPSSEVRTAMARFLTELARFIKISAVAFEGAGFRAAAVRGVVTGLTMLARQPYPHKVFATMPEAAQWLGRSLRETAKLEVDSESLVKALGELRERVAKEHPKA
jgi:hypothetical protein